jgi:hypothetical protein
VCDLFELERTAVDWTVLELFRTRGLRSLRGKAGTTPAVYGSVVARNSFPRRGSNMVEIRRA